MARRGEEVPLGLIVVGVGGVGRLVGERCPDAEDDGGGDAQDLDEPVDPEEEGLEPWVGRRVRMGIDVGIRIGV